MEAQRSSPILVSHKVWDPVVRWFHWINFLSVLALSALGLLLLNDDALELGKPAREKIESVHVLFGYVFAANLAVRLCWAFVGKRVARWRAILPIGGRYRAELRRYVQNLRRGRAHTYLGHNPLGRISVTALFALLLTEAISGLALADVFAPRPGHWVEEVHEIVFWLLVVMIAMHVVAVIVTEIRGGSALISAMFSGRKIVDVRQAEPREPRPPAG
jgi:Ni/Fe-hydrogenase 1 B-type cytochrome subunit